MVRRIGVANLRDGAFAMWLYHEESPAWTLVLANSGLLFHMAERVEACLAFLGGSEPCGECSTCCRSVDL